MGFSELLMGLSVIRQHLRLSKLLLEISRSIYRVIRTYNGVIIRKLSGVISTFVGVIVLDNYGFIRNLCGTIG